MKIVFVLPDMPGGGTERVVALLSDELVHRGYQVAILLFAGNRVAYSLNEKIEIHVSGQASGGSISLRLKRLLDMRRFFKENKNCYIFAFSAMGAVFSVLSAAGIPHRMLVSERNDPSRYEHQKIRNWAYQKAEKLILQTEDMKKGFPAKLQKKAVVIPNPVASDMPEPFEGERKKRIVTAARLQPQKNQKLLIQAFAEFVKAFPMYELHLFGEGDLEKELRQQVKELHLDKQVFFRGFSIKAKDEIRESAMFVLTSDYEGISNSMIEALSMGVPVISTDCPVGGSRAYIENHVSGILTPVGDAKALTEAMMKIAGDEDFAKKLSTNARKVKERYSLFKIVDRLVKEAGIEWNSQEKNTAQF